MRTGQSTSPELPLSFWARKTYIIFLAMSAGDIPGYALESCRFGFVFPCFAAAIQPPGE